MGIRLKCVLLIDDDNVTNFLHKQILLRAGIAHNIVVAETVKEGVDLLVEREGCEEPELIFVDLNMPGLNGWDFIEKFKTIKAGGGKNSRVFVLSASANPEDKKVAGDIEEVDGFLSKPLTNTMINEIINEHFSK